MNVIERAIMRARRRVFWQSTVTAWGWLIVAGLFVGLALYLIEKLLAFSVPMWVYGIVAGVGAVVAPIFAWTRRVDDAAAAALIDERLQLKDRLGTALYAKSLAQHPFANQVIRDAEQAASTVALKEALPVKLTRGWGYVPLAAALVAVVAVFVSYAQPDPFGMRRVKDQQQADAADADEAARNIVQAKALIRDLTTAESDRIEEADSTQVWKELAMLTRRDLTNPEQRGEALAKLSDIQDKLAVAEQAKEKEVQAMRSAMSRLETGGKGPADRFADALRRGDYEAAAAELKALEAKVEQMSIKDKQQLQQQLQNMQQQLQKMAEQQAQQQQKAQQQIREQLAEGGLNEQQIQQLQQQGYNSQAVQQALQNQGMSQQQAEQMAQKIQQQQQQCRQCNNQGQNQSGLSQSLGQMAQSLGQPQSQQGQQGQQNQQGQQGQQSQGQGSQDGFGQSAWSAQQALNQMSQMQDQMQQMQQARSQLHNAMQNLRQGGGGGQQSSSGGAGGRHAGTGEGGNPLGQERQPGPYTYHARSDIQQREGRVIASWYQNGQMVAGAPTVEFDQAVTEARDNAERAVADDRVPRRYHETVREYFKQLPDSPDSIGRAPAAPR